MDGIMNPFNNPSTHYPTNNPTPQYTTNIPNAFNLTHTTYPTPSVYPTITPTQITHSIPHQAIAIQSVPQYHPVAVPVFPQQQSRSDLNKLDTNKFENELNQVNVKYNNLNNKMDELMTFIKNTNNSNSTSTNHNKYTQPQPQQRYQEMSVIDGIDDDICDERYILRGSKRLNKSKSLKKNIIISRDKHEEILWNAINYQTGSISRLESYTGIDTETLKTSFKYWSSRNMMVKHGNGGHKLIVELKKHRINVNNKFINRLRSNYGEFEFEQLDMNEQMDAGGESESEFFCGDTPSPNELNVHILIEIFLSLCRVYICSFISNIILIQIPSIFCVVRQETNASKEKFEKRQR